ncbi:MAG: metal-dependent hydrolase [Candidatus Atribacteria bacterium]|nr:metal-dependent hydrolase [Candidatus Atribacteria bacterium]
MLLFGHLGITLGVFEAGASISRWGKGKKIDLESIFPLILIGSMLPDIIDKPLGGIIFKNQIGNGRIYAHTLLFLLGLFAIGIYFRRRFHSNTGLILAMGCLIHEGLDELWLQPFTFFWPLYGWAFPKENSEEWLHMWISGLLNNPGVYIPELIGVALLLGLVPGFVRRK